MDDSPVRKTGWLLRLYGMMIKCFMAGSYGGFEKMNKPDSGAFWERSGRIGQ